ncbi:MAG TPA: hypothetical protein VN838_11375, partial [Bradyrhizobium sp.]|nr:hypothetical protein [Bradyrhizobium sp.]
EAVQANAVAGVNAQIDWNKKTMFLSNDDVAIARQLAPIYKNDIPAALASSEAATMRLQSAQALIVTGFRDIGESVVSAALSGKNAMQALMGGLDAVAGKMAKAGFNNAVDGLLSGNVVQAGLGAAELAGSAIISAFTGDQKKQEQLRKARAEWETTAPTFVSFLQPAPAVQKPTNENERKKPDERLQYHRAA